MASECVVCDRPTTEGRSQCEACRRYRSRHNGVERPLALIGIRDEWTQEPTLSPEAVGVLTEAVAREQFVVYLMDDVDGPVGLEELVDRPEWMASGACRGADAGRFFPGRGQDVRPAKALCARCPVRADCLEYALADTGLQGIWGGTSARERRQIRFRFTRRSA